jgi:DUF2945 family protein
MSDHFRIGDKVNCTSHGSTVTGTVEEKIVSDSETAGRTVRASGDEPQYRVRSAKSGATRSTSRSHYVGRTDAGIVSPK